LTILSAPLLYAKLAALIRRNLALVVEGQHRGLLANGVSRTRGIIANLGTVRRRVDKFVFDGPFVEAGVPDFTGKLKPEETTFTAT